jgi:HK97 family phage prohead protease
MLILKGFVDKSEKESDGLLDVSVASTAVVDRDGESINQDGWDLKNFKKNPQLLWAHNMREVRPPIGKVTKIWFEGEGKSRVMKFKALFDTADEFAKEIYRKIKDGFLNAFSVGFMPMEREGTTYTKVELLEISVVPIPSNPQALVEMRSKGIAPMTWKDVAEVEPDEKPEEQSEVVEGDETISTPAEEVTEPKLDDVSAENGEDGEVELSKEDMKAMLKEVMKEIRQDKDQKDMDTLRDSLRIVYQAVAIALKNIKELKGGE